MSESDRLKVLVTWRPDNLEQIKNCLEGIEVHDTVNREEMLDLMEDAEVAYVTGFDTALFKRAKKLRWVHVATDGETRLTVHMTIQEQNEAVIIEKIESPYAPVVGTWVGKRMGIHCTAAGKALISDWLEEDIDRLVHCGLPRYNENTIISPRKLKLELAQVRKQGFSVDDEEETIGSRCIGAPITNQAGRIVSAVSVAGNKEQIYNETFYSLAKDVKETAAEISHELALSQDVSPDEIC